MCFISNNVFYFEDCNMCWINIIFVWILSKNCEIYDIFNDFLFSVIFSVINYLYNLFILFVVLGYVCYVLLRIYGVIKCIKYVVWILL